MQVERTKKRIHESAVYLTEQYPLLCTLNTSKKSGFSEVRLRDRRSEEDKSRVLKVSKSKRKPRRVRKLSKKQV